jgi:hypothetical protein
MPYVVPGIVRYTINGRLGSRDVANVLDYRIDTTGGTSSRADSAFNMAGILINEWSAEVLINLSSAYSFTSVSWVDLDSASGSTGVRTTSGAISLPTAGSLTGDPLPGNVSQLVTKATASQRGRRSGRLFLAGLTEADTSGNNILAARLTVWETRWAAFLGDTNQETPSIGTYQSFLAVSHVLTRDVNGDPLTGESTDVDSLAPAALLATQRRRLRG